MRSRDKRRTDKLGRAGFDYVSPRRLGVAMMSANRYGDTMNSAQEAVVLSTGIAPRRPAMKGVITIRDVVTHIGLIWREFGPGCFLRCLGSLLSRRPTTFLEVAVRLR